ncbi:rod shape-determining protein MreC [Desulfotomaculum copahuensis]|uniref:Cell shape-determining protein MreC n=2 Tax=Desulfotomaculum copahuensis TaxID=1838280 RepID=A0A1B7LHD7_9FIRM|nr:rod shape-determining protein MreC [Desulfotomaculum copahuensis]
MAEGVCEVANFSGKKIILAAILLVAVFMLMRATAFGRVGVTPLEGALRDALSPVQQVTTRVGQGMRNFFTAPFSLVEAARQEKRLSREIKDLQGQLRQAGEYRLESQRLQKLLDFKENTAGSAGFQTTAAAVVGRDPGNWFSTITLNKGTADGLKADMTVLAPEGLVGRIIAVSPHTAQVLLLTDPRSAVSSLLQDTRAPGLVEGTGGATGGLRMKNIPTDTPVHAGQVVVSSGTGSLFPKGVPIGQVTGSNRDPTGLFYDATVRPFVDFNRLEEVLVVTSVQQPANTGQKISGNWSQFGR